MRSMNTAGKVGAVLVGLIVLITLLAPVIAKYGPEQIDPGAILVGPNSSHWFGTDQNGMDVFTRTIYAPRVDLVIALVATALAMLVGVPLGVIAGIREDRGGVGGFIAQVIMRTADIFQAIPVFVFALAVVAVLGKGSVNVILALGFVNAPVFLRLIRTEVILKRDSSFVEAATLAGWSHRRIAFRHILPNAIAPAISQASVVLGYSILLTAGLSFVGAGVQVPTAEWGVMISQGATNIATGQWWTSFFPGIAMAITVLCLGLLGEGTRDAFDRGTMRLALRSKRRMRKAMAARPAADGVTEVEG
jgi:peptide/nickel transport system permease protein